MRHVLSSTPWVERTRSFALTMRASTRRDHGLLLVGTPGEEPWHLAAHLDDEARFAGIPELAPVLVRHEVPDGAPAHLRVGLERIEAAQRGETLFIVAPDTAPSPLLERAWDARRKGATIMSMHVGDADLESIAHESILVPPSGLILPESSRASAPGSLDVMLSTAVIDSESSPLMTFDVLEHLVSCAIGEDAIASPTPSASTSSSRRRVMRDRLGRLLDSISGATSHQR